MHCGFTKEEDLLEMTYGMYKNIILEIGKKLNYEAVVNLLGNMGAGEGVSDTIESANPLSSLMGSGSKFERITAKDVRELQGLNNKGW